MSCNACVGCDEPSLAVASSGAAALDRMIASALTDLHVALSDAEQTKWELHFNVRLMMHPRAMPTLNQPHLFLA